MLEIALAASMPPATPAAVAMALRMKPPPAACWGGIIPACCIGAPCCIGIPPCGALPQGLPARGGAPNPADCRAADGTLAGAGGRDATPHTATMMQTRPYCSL